MIAFGASSFQIKEKVLHHTLHYTNPKFREHFLKIAGLVHKIQFQKKETPPALYDFVQLASAVNNYGTRYATNQNL